ncbi:MAG: hypothetical protein IPL93_06770 [Actinomycetales bacterium]|nr:hypothetical protein [Actinomycetales bacterium]
MSIFTTRPWTRWAVPTAAVALVAAGSVAVSSTATADPTLPPMTPAELLVAVQQARPAGLSGTVVQTSDLGLPSLTLPGMSSGRGSAELSGTITGTHTWRVWLSGPSKARLALLGQGGESDIVRDGKDIWVWSSSSKEATHYLVPETMKHPTSLGDLGALPGKTGMPSATGAPAASVARGAAGAPGATPLPTTPQEAADKLLAMVDPSTEVTVPGTTTVAGRAAYQLVLTPRAKESLVASVRLAVDAETKVPLRVQVMSTRIATPAFEVGFTAVDFGVPDAQTFAFTPPAGTTVTEGKTPMTGDQPADKGANSMVPGELPGKATPPGSGIASAKPKFVGTGWATVVIVKGEPMTGSSPDGESSGQGKAPDSMTSMLQQLPTTSGAWGTGRVLEGTIFTAVLADDGRVAIGAVPADRLYAALAAGS